LSGIAMHLLPSIGTSMQSCRWKVLSDRILASVHGKGMLIWLLVCSSAITREVPCRVIYVGSVFLLLTYLLT